MMTIWLWIALVSNVVYWGIFFFLVSHRRWTKASLAVGVLHMIFASLLVVAPIRSLIDPNYIGYSIGFIRFEASKERQTDHFSTFSTQFSQHLQLTFT
jgi:hypothetical protein